MAGINRFYTYTTNGAKSMDVYIPRVSQVSNTLQTLLGAFYDVSQNSNTLNVIHEVKKCFGTSFIYFQLLHGALGLSLSQATHKSVWVAKFVSAQTSLILAATYVPTCNPKALGCMLSASLEMRCKCSTGAG